MRYAKIANALDLIRRRKSLMSTIVVLYLSRHLVMKHMWCFPDLNSRVLGD
jgi:hypothetical protein